MTNSLPCALDSERAFLGSLLLAPHRTADWRALCSPADFYHPPHTAILGAIYRLDDAKQPIDSVTVATQMQADGTAHMLRGIGGEAYFSDLTCSVPTVESAPWHGKRVRAKAIARQLVEAASEIVRAGYADPADVDAYLAESQAKIADVAALAVGGGELVPFKKVMRDVQGLLELRYNRKQAITGIPSGFDELDALTGGFQAGHLVLVAARPKMGKSAFWSACVEYAARAGFPCLAFSLEMSAEELGERALSSAASVNTTAIRTGRFGGPEWGRLASGMSRLAGIPVHVCDRAGMNFAQIRALARKWRAQHTDPSRPAFIVVDYLTLIDTASDGRRDANREQAVAAISRGLKHLAKELQVPIMALAQINRGPESRADKRPTPADLRESGSLEADADMVALLYRDEVYNAETQAKGIAEVIIAAHRHGGTGVIRLRWRGEYTRFENLDARE